MNERLLQFIWQFQYFNRNYLQTEQGEDIIIIHPGLYNTNQGPDFLGATLKIGDTTWAGNVELHVQSSEWDKHGHTSDVNYRNVILHVVWQHDNCSEYVDTMPTLVLEPRVSTLLLQQYERWMQNPTFVPCAGSIHQVNHITWEAVKERTLVERLERKAEQVFTLLQQNHQHWENIVWRLVARNFGIKVNADAFDAMAATIPINILSKHKNQLHQLEAMLLGQAGLLDGSFEEAYPRMLKREYHFLKNKYHFHPNSIHAQFLRMRPSSFPTIRLAQLAMLMNQTAHLFSTFKEINSLQELKELLNITANDYWHYHYRFDELSEFHPKHLGNQMSNNIIINTVIPILFAYGLYHKEQSFTERTLEWLEQIPSEKNTITRNWEQLSVMNTSAYDSQALIELKTHCCDKRKCLSCPVGNALLKKAV